MANGQELEVREKKEVVSAQEKTIPARFYVPATDIYETQEALKLVMEIPGVAKDAVDVKIENDVLTVEGRIDAAQYAGLDPLYTEYPVGHFARGFTLPRDVDRDHISAELNDGVLVLTLNKAPAAQPRRIAIS
jgi:HSP20 family molecular chaperone IbpA